MDDASLQPHTVVGIGELLWDCFDETRRPGGAPSNVAFHATQLGARGLPVSRVGNDAAGEALLSELSSRGIPTDSIQRDPVRPTGWVTVNTRCADQPTYEIHQDVAWDHIEPDGLTGVLNQASAVCFGSLAQRSPTSRATVQQLVGQRGHALSVFDVNLRPPWYTREVIELSLGLSDVVKLNHEEVAAVTDLLQLDAADVDRFAASLRDRFGVRIVCVTRGADGCRASTADRTVDVPGRSVDVADSVGAGDAFTAAFVCGLLWDRPLEDTAPFANEVGALVAGRQGAMPDLRGKFEALRRRFAPK